MSTDPTQVPPFGAVVSVTAGTVAQLHGYANQHWVDQQNDPALILAPVGTDIGDLYDGATFTRPEPVQPITKEDPDA